MRLPTGYFPCYEGPPLPEGSPLTIALTEFKLPSTAKFLISSACLCCIIAL
jgi:hypothetical protein